MQSDSPKTRERFEKWWIGHHGDFLFTTRLAHYAWDAWQAASTREQELEEALRQLKCEVFGALSIARPEIVAAISETNVRCIEYRLERAEALLARPEGKDKGEVK